MAPPPSASRRLFKLKMTIMSLGFILVALALASPSSAARVAPWPWSGGGHRRSAVLLMAPGGRAALSPAAPESMSTSHGAPATDRVAAKPRQVVPLPPSGPSIRGHV
ncbi:hypothetical protein SEVIR_5G142251v4 [Setaria viridis]